MKDVPLKINMQILSMVPAKSLGVMKCVSVQHNALISTKSFIIQHLKSSKDQNRIHLIHRFTLGFQNITYYLNRECNPNQDCYERRSFDDDPLPIYVDSINGLVLSLGNEEELFLCNPITGASISITLPTITWPRFVISCSTWYGLGYKEETDEYIVMRLENFDSQPPLCKCFLFTTSTKKWVEIQHFPLSYLGLHHGVFVHGSNHQRCFSPGMHSLWCLNLDRECWEEFYGPDDLDSKEFF